MGGSASSYGSYIQAGMDIPKEWVEELLELSGGEVKETQI